MSRTFDLVIESAVSVEQLHSALGNEDYWVARLAAFGRNTTLDSLIVDADGTVTVATAQDLRHQALPAMVARVFPGGLKILRTETWKPVGGRRVSGEISVWSPGALVSGIADASLEPMHGGSRVRFTATVQVKVPLVGGRIENNVCGQLAEQIRAMQRFTGVWITEHCCR